MGGGAGNLGRQPYRRGRQWRNRPKSRSGHGGSGPAAAVRVVGVSDPRIQLPGPSLNSVLVDVDDVKTAAELRTRLRDFAKAHPGLPWITGRGWSYAVIPHNIAHRSHIYAVIADGPVYLRGRDGRILLFRIGTADYVKKKVEWYSNIK